MNEEEKWRLVNQSKTVEDLKKAVKKIGYIEISSGKVWSSKFMCEQIDRALRGEDLRLLTRNYGIRQQLVYIKFNR